MYLDELFGYKNRLMDDLLTSESIVRLIDENVSIEDAGSLMYKRVFPYEYVPETVEDGKTFICCDVDLLEVYDKTFLAPVLYVWVFSHRSKLRLPDGGVRPDMLCHEICKKINGSRQYGMGELNLRSLKRFAPMTDYLGKMMSFEAKDFNRQYDPKRYTPANRKA